MKRSVKQSRTVYEWESYGQIYKVHSITREEIPMTSKFKKVESLDELSQGMIYYWKGLNGRLSHSLMYDIHDPFVSYEDYRRILQKQIDRGIVFIRPEPKQKKKKDTSTPLFDGI